MTEELSMRTPLLLTLALLGVACSPASRRADLLAPALASGLLAVEGGQLYYETRGRGPALVLVHGGFGDHRMWDDQFAALSRDFRVVRYDHRGFGRSSAPAAAYSPAADLLRLLDHLGIERAHLVGNSVGGASVLDFALLHPARTDRVVVVSSGANGYPYTPEDLQGIAAVFNAARHEGPDRAAEMWLQHPMVAVTSRHSRTAARLQGMVRENRGIFQMAQWPREPLNPAAFRRLDQIRRPVLFVVGGDDTPMVRRSARESADRVPGAQWQEISGADHLPQMVKPEEFNAVLRRFLNAR
ncbi:MAG TPA: alpha/beta fold hydrolase [Longimicrobium sp.]|jgi:pimeloyl-ACP methyl ester carboxylesterase|nr:alpha/beta fold hydrolase [Longimicrobium sp.]